MLKELLKNPIAFHPTLARAFGGIHEAIFWQQIYYWSDKTKNKDGWVYKSKKEIEEETTITKRQQDRVRESLVKLGVLELKIKKANNAPTLHYRVNIKKVEELLLRLSQNVIITECDVGKSQKVILESNKRGHSITETTTETTTDITCEAHASQKCSDPKRTNTTYNPLGAELIKAFESLNPAAKRFYANITQREACDDLLEAYGLEKTKRVINLLEKTNRMRYMPTITTPLQLREKWAQLESHVKRRQEEFVERKSNIAFT